MAGYSLSLRKAGGTLNSQLMPTCQEEPILALAGGGTNSAVTD
jgi:hypothetical protein